MTSSMPGINRSRIQCPGVEREQKTDQTRVNVDVAQIQSDLHNFRGPDGSPFTVPVVGSMPGAGLETGVRYLQRVVKRRSSKGVG